MTSNAVEKTQPNMETCCENMSTTKSDKRHEEECGTYTRKKHKHTTVPTEINNKKTHNKVYHTLEITLIPHPGADVRLQLTHIYTIYDDLFFTLCLLIEKKM